MIGNDLTEVNVTSPTGACELKKLAGIDLMPAFLQVVEAKIGERAARR